jgi:hypothetical protein
MDADSHLDPVCDSYAEMAYGLYRIATLGRRHSRIIGALTRTVSQPSGEVETVAETIDGSVFDRWRNDSDYRPIGVSAWAERLKLNPMQVVGTRKTRASA